MLEQIHSKREPNRVLHQVYRRQERYPEQRHDLCDPSEALQVAVFSLDTTHPGFRPHQHVHRERLIPMTQEAWVVVQGSVQADYYDTDGTPLCSRELTSGDVTMTFAGGHTYQCLADNTDIVEIKTGDYQGVEGDKVFL